MSKRYVPAIWGVVSIGVAVWLAFSFTGWWKIIPGTLLLAFGWMSLKTAFSATDREIEELTGQAPISEKTKERLKNRL